MTRFFFMLGLCLALTMTPTFAQEKAEEKPSGTTAAQDTTVEPPAAPAASAGETAGTTSAGEAAATTSAGETAATSGAAAIEWTCAHCKVAVQGRECQMCGKLEYGCEHCKIAQAKEGKCACGADFKKLE